MARTIHTAALSAIVLFAAACGERQTATRGPTLTPQADQGPVQETPPEAVEFHTAVPGVRFLRIGMTVEELKAHDVPIEWTTRNMEGEDYDVAKVTLAPDQSLNATFDKDGALYSIEADTPGVKDNMGAGVGTLLGDLQAACPSGRLAVGLEEGRYARFLSGGMLVFEFNPEEFPEDCFTIPAECTPAVTLPVRKVVLYGTHLP